MRAKGSRVTKDLRAAARLDKVYDGVVWRVSVLPETAWGAKTCLIWLLGDSGGVVGSARNDSSFFAGVTGKVVMIERRSFWSGDEEVGEKIAGSQVYASEFRSGSSPHI